MKLIRRILLTSLALLITLGAAWAEPITNEEEITMNTFTPTWENVKPLGRTHQLKDSLWLCFSGSGAEFTFHGSRCEVTIAGDINAYPSKRDELVRIAIYVDGVRVVDDMIDAKEKTYTVMAEETARDAVVRIVKLSETAMSTCGVKAISVDDSAGIRPTPAKARKIEFIGDSITCGYGVDDEVAEHHFSTTTEDVTRAYAYRTAEMLDADYSMVSISGYGVISGYTATGEEKVTAQQLPKFYEKLGFSYGTYQKKIAAATKWDFSAYEPDVIVINLAPTTTATPSPMPTARRNTAPLMWSSSRSCARTTPTPASCAPWASWATASTPPSARPWRTTPPRPAIPTSPA